MNDIVRMMQCSWVLWREWFILSSTPAFINLSIRSLVPRAVDLAQRPFLGDRINSRIIGKFDRVVRASSFRYPEFCRIKIRQLTTRMKTLIGMDRLSRARSDLIKGAWMRIRVRLIEYVAGSKLRSRFNCEVVGANHVASC